MYADELLIQKDTEQIFGRDNVIFENPEFRLKSDSMELDDASQTADFGQSEYEFSLGHAHGKAFSINRLDPDRTVFTRMDYTSCDPGDPDWKLSARKLKIDQESGRGTASHAILYFQHVPFLYTPWFQFPIDDRRMSGVLTPSIGYTEDGGRNVTVPVYWNMAPNYDMTITPSNYTKRGLQLNTENRYLTRNSYGQVDLSYLDDDEYDDTRWYQRWQHFARLDGGVNADLLLVDVSDNDFFDDFDNVAPQYNEVDHLERRFGLSRSWDYWNSTLQWQDYLTPNEAASISSRPYNRLPQLTINSVGVPLFAGTEGQLETEWVEFDRDDSVTGKRTHIVTTLGWESRNSWYFFEPELQYAFTDYELEDNPEGNSIYRHIPTASLDSGLIFERLAGSQSNWTQTLEPRLFFLYTPFEDQDDIPDFDTSLASSTYNNLFRNDRFVGADRIGDASQVTFGLASQLFDNDSGNRLMYARAGQIYYFRDRRVSLNGQEEDASTSDIIAQIDIWPNPYLKIASRMVFAEEQDEELTEQDVSINYARDGFAANAEYYYEEDELEQALVSFVYPINERWMLIGKEHRSLLFEEKVETLVGFHRLKPTLLRLRPVPNVGRLRRPEN